MSSRQYTVALIGAGRIAAGFDQPGSEAVLTHAHAFTANHRFKCLGFYDVNREAMQSAASKWSLRSYDSLDSILAEKPEVIVIAVPDEGHAEMIKRSLQVSPRLILCEKPLTSSTAESLALARLCMEKGVILAVNYQRRYDETCIKIRDEFAAGKLGRAVCGVVNYSKGILHNGSHAVDLLRFIFGEARSISVSRKVMDFTATDPTVAGAIRFDGFEVALQAADERLFSLFEIDLIFEKGRFRLTQSGTQFERFEVKDDPVYAGYRELLAVETAPTGLLRALPAMVNDLAYCLDQGAVPRIAVQNVLGSQAVCEQLACATETQGRVLTPMEGAI